MIPTKDVIETTLVVAINGWYPLKKDPAVTWFVGIRMPIVSRAAAEVSGCVTVPKTLKNTVGYESATN